MSGPLVAGVELGGTKAVAAVGRGRAIVARTQLPTTTPADTLGALAEWLAAQAGPIAAVGVASFGPVRVDSAAPDFGRMLATPKPGWAGTDVFRPFRRFGPVALHTDVAAAALGEGAWGAAQGLPDYVYVTVGTGVGFGVIAGGRALTGALHPEAGHMRVRRAPYDPFPGACPFHGDCLEGLASGPALAARAGRPAAGLDADHPAWRFAADALAEAFLATTLTVAPQRFVVGGGVGLGAPWLWPEVARRMAEKNAGYLAALPAITPAALGADAGVLGAMLLAGAAASR